MADNCHLWYLTVWDESQKLCNLNIVTGAFTRLYIKCNWLNVSGEVDPFNDPVGSFVKID